jgi:hypothetical protein
MILELSARITGGQVWRAIMSTAGSDRNREDTRLGWYYGPADSILGAGFEIRVSNSVRRVSKGDLHEEY